MIININKSRSFISTINFISTIKDQTIRQTISNIQNTSVFCSTNIDNSQIILNHIMIIRSNIRHSFNRIRQNNHINSLISLIVSEIPLSLITSYRNCMINILTIMFSTRINHQSNISTISQVSNCPNTSFIIIIQTRSTINKLKVIRWEKIFQSNVSCISTITGIGNSNSPNSNIINKILILITSNIHRQINNRNRINSQISCVLSSIRTSNSQIISQITNILNSRIPSHIISNEITIINPITNTHNINIKSNCSILTSSNVSYKP